MDRQPQVEVGACGILALDLKPGKCEVVLTAVDGRPERLYPVLGRLRIRVCGRPVGCRSGRGRGSVRGWTGSWTTGRSRRAHFGVGTDASSCGGSDVAAGGGLAPAGFHVSRSWFAGGLGFGHRPKQIAQRAGAETVKSTLGSGEDAGHTNG